MRCVQDERLPATTQGGASHTRLVSRLARNPYEKAAPPAPTHARARARYHAAMRVAAVMPLPLVND